MSHCGTTRKEMVNCISGTMHNLQHVLYLSFYVPVHLRSAAITPTSRLGVVDCQMRA